VLGNTFDRGVESTDINPTLDRIVRGNAKRFGGTRGQRRPFEAVHN